MNYGFDFCDALKSRTLVLSVDDDNLKSIGTIIQTLSLIIVIACDNLA